MAGSRISVDIGDQQHDENQRRARESRAWADLQAQQLRAQLGDSGVPDALDELIDALVPVARMLASTIRTAGAASPEQVDQADRLGRTLRTLHAARTLHEADEGDDPANLSTAELQKRAKERR